MGLITEEDNTVNTNVITDIITTVNGIVTDTIPIHTQTMVCTDGSSSSLWDDTNSIDMSIYRIFSMQEDMKILYYPDRIRNEFDLFLQYAEDKTLGIIDSNYDEIDTYLGSIGITNEMCEV